MEQPVQNFSWIPNWGLVLVWELSFWNPIKQNNISAARLQGASICTETSFLVILKTEFSVQNIWRKASQPLRDCFPSCMYRWLKGLPSNMLYWISVFRFTKMEVSVQLHPPCSLAADMLYWELRYLNLDIWAVGAKLSFIQPHCNQLVQVALFFGSIKGSCQCGSSG